MILSTVPGIVTLESSAILEASRFRSAIRADLAMRGFANSFLTLARLARPDSSLACLCAMHSQYHRRASCAVPFRTPPSFSELSGLCAKRGIHLETKGSKWPIWILNPTSLGF